MLRTPRKERLPFMKKLLLLLFAITLSVFTGMLYFGVLPARLHDIFDRHAPMPVTQVVHGIGGVREFFSPYQPLAVAQTDILSEKLTPLPSGIAERELHYITRQVLYGALAAQEDITIPATLPPGDYNEVTEYLMSKVELAVDIIRRDIPEIFWLSLGAFGIEWSGNMTTREGVLTVRLTYRHTPEQIQGLRTQINRVVQNVLDTAPSDTLGKITHFHDWVVTGTTYACYVLVDLTSQGQHAFNIDGVFLRGSAVCEGYSKAFALLCNLAGIPNVIVYGVAGGENHSWNYVYLEGQWYLIDPTWNSPIGEENILLHTFFLLGSHSMVGDLPVYQIFTPDSAEYPSLSPTGFFS